MVSGKMTKAVSGGGAWMVAVALQIIPNTWPNLLRPHPWAVGLFVLIGAAMFIYAAFGSQHPEGDAKSNSAGRDNSGYQINTQGGSVSFGDGGIATGERHAKTETYIPPSGSAQKLSRLEVFDIEFVQATLNRGRWSASNQGDRCVVIPVYNPPAEMGEQSVTINPLSSHLLFREDGRVLANVAKAYWIDTAFNEVAIETGDRKYVILGTVRQSSFTAWGNRLRPIGNVRMGNILSIPMPETNIMSVASKMEIEVNLIVDRTTVAKFYLDAIKTDQDVLRFERRRY
jgi:hypothetical protein